MAWDGYPIQLKNGPDNLSEKIDKCPRLVTWAHEEPEFQSFLQRAEKEFGFDHDMGLNIPCEEVAVQSLTSTLHNKDQPNSLREDQGRILFYFFYTS